MNIFIGAVILIAVCLVLGKIFDWFGEKTGVILIAVLGGALVSLLFAAGVHALTEASLPPGCKTTYVC